LRLDGLYRQFYPHHRTDSAALCWLLARPGDLRLLPATGHYHDGWNLVLALYLAGGPHLRAVFWGGLLSFAPPWAYPWLGALSALYPLAARDFDGLFPGLVDPAQSGCQSGRGAQNGRCAPSPAGSFGGHVGEEYCSEHHDPEHVLKLFDLPAWQ